MNKEKQNNQNRILFLSLLSVQRSLSIKYNECSMKCADESDEVSAASEYFSYIKGSL